MLLAIEDHLLQTVRELFGSKLRTVESLPGDWDDAMLKRLLLSAPAVYLAWLGGIRDRQAGSLVLGGRWEFLVITAHASGPAARRRGDARQLGAYEIVEILAPALDGRVVPEAGTIKVERVANLYNGTIDRQGASVYSIACSLPVPFEGFVDAATLDDFLKAHVDYDINQDGQADVSDDIDLPQ